jgi:hypothetical protein
LRQLQLDAELENSDRVVATYTRTYEFLDQPFEIASGVSLPVGGYAFHGFNASSAWARRGARRRQLRWDTAPYYSATITSFEAGQGRMPPHGPPDGGHSVGPRSA